MNKYEISTSCQIANLSQVLLDLFGYREGGMFIEVGAHDGYSFSNTWGLAEAGWEGIYYEPIEELVLQCMVRHAKNAVIVRNIAIGDKNGKTKLYMGWSPTIDEDTMHRSPWGDTYDPSNYIVVECHTLDWELNYWNIQPEFDLLVIDVEGAELLVLAGFSIDKWKPQVVIVETHDRPDPRVSYNAPKINEYFAQHGYVIYQNDGLNTIYRLNKCVAK